MSVSLYRLQIGSTSDRHTKLYRPASTMYSKFVPVFQAASWTRNVIASRAYPGVLTCTSQVFFVFVMFYTGICMFVRISSIILALSLAAAMRFPVLDFTMIR